MALVKTSRARPRGAARREALLEAVLAIVAETGADAVTHRRVAEAAGLPLASTTYYFDSKDHLLSAAIELAAERDIRRLDAIAAEAEAGGEPASGGEAGAPRATRDRPDPLQQIIAVLRQPVAEADAGRRGQLLADYTLVLEAARRPALRAVAARWTEAYVTTLAVLLEQAGSRQPRADAQLVLAAYDGLLLDQLASGVSADLSSRLRRLVRALLASGPAAEETR